MKLSALPLLALLLAPALRAESRLSSAVEAIPRNLIASSGGISTGIGLSLDYTVGESAITGAAGEGFKTQPGLMPL